MNRIIALSITLTIVGGLIYFGTEMYGFTNGVRPNAIPKLKGQQDSTGIYFIDLPAGLDTIVFKVSIVLDPAKKMHKIRFPNGGTATTVSLYDHTYLKTIQQNILPEVKALVTGSFNYEQEVLLDITLLKRGQYYVHYLSCGLGGIFLLTIK